MVNTKLRVAVIYSLLLMVAATLLSAPASAADIEVTGVVFTWKNMGLMGPGDESAHYVSVTRSSETIQHSVEYHHGEIVQKIILYRTDDGARFRLLDALGDAARGWAST
jgi:hypothetical protein